MIDDRSRRIRVALFGAAPDTPNMGVSALYKSAISGIAEYVDNLEFVIFDNGLGCRHSILELPNGKTIPLLLFGARAGHRYFRPENLATMALLSRFRKLGAIFNQGIRLIDSCVAILDVSGGDSFSDIYGRKRFDSISRPKQIAINRGKLLILLPQTYGPYKDHDVSELAKGIVAKANMVWARDENSFAILKTMLGQRFDPQRHRCGVDMAFGLLPSVAEGKLDPTLKSWIKDKDVSCPVIGFNVSGLIYNNPQKAISEYRFVADYRKIVKDFLRWLLENTAVRIVLISHVMDMPGHYESDLGACMDIFAQLGDEYASRVKVVPATLDQSEVKWLISKMDWFCGTRMHSTIASLSSGVPTAAISYSDKTNGVFETCGQGGQVFDPRLLYTDQVINGLIQSFDTRGAIRESLKQRLPQVMNTASNQMERIANQILAAR